MTPAELMAAWRSDVVDTAAPYLWSDVEAWRYLNDAYIMFWRLVGGIPDFTSVACQVPVVAGVATSALHPSILRILAANRRSDFGTLEIINSTDLGRLRSSDYGQAKELRLDNMTGQIRYMVIGMQKDVARWVQIPEVDDTVDLRVFRTPLLRITSASTSFAELDEDHHIHLMHWMKYLAYSKQDAETFDKGRAAEFEGKFNAYCAQYKREQERYAHKTRTTQYGGI